jgi:autotransporter translocation and assembly factor TamB
VVGVDDSAFVRLIDSLAPHPVARDANPSLLKRVELGKVDVVMGPNVWIRSAEASVQLGGSIGLERAAPQPGVVAGGMALRGTLVTQRGNYRLNVGAITRSFELEQGSVQFSGEPELNPRLDINAIYTREGRDDEPGSRRAPRVRAHLGGTLERPVLTLSSADSKLSQAELMSYLITGQAHFALGDMNEGVVTSELVASATGALAQRLAGGHFDMVSVTAGTSNDRDDERGSAAANAFAASRLGVGKQLSTKLFVKVDAGLCALTNSAASTDLWQTMGVSLDYRFRRSLLGSISSAPSTNGAECANQAAGRGTALTPRQWGLDFHRIWRF